MKLVFNFLNLRQKGVVQLLGKVGENGKAFEISFTSLRNRSGYSFAEVKNEVIEVHLIVSFIFRNIPENALRFWQCDTKEENKESNQGLCLECSQPYLPSE